MATCRHDRVPLPLVGKLIVDWTVDHEGAVFEEITKEDRWAFFVAEYRKDPIGLAQEMWKPVCRVID